MCEFSNELPQLVLLEAIQNEMRNQKIVRFRTLPRPHIGLNKINARNAVD